MNTILVTTDFSTAALNAAKYAIGLANALGANQLIIYHSYDITPVVADVPTLESDRRFALEGSLTALESLESQLRTYGSNGLDIKLVSNELPLLIGVEQLVEEHRIGLVVAGASGKSNLEKFMIGSNALSLASSCPAPLLIVPKDVEFKKIDKVVFACDLKKVSNSTPVGQISSLLDRLDAKLLVLNVAPEGKQVSSDTIVEQRALHRLLDGLSPTYHYTESDDIADEITDFADNEGAGLIISIPKAYGFFDKLFRRSVSKRLIKETETPLLLLREKE